MVLQRRHIVGHHSQGDKPLDWRQDGPRLDWCDCDGLCRGPERCSLHVNERRFLYLESSEL